eukprot:s1_g2598.t1
MTLGSSDYLAPYPNLPSAPIPSTDRSGKEIVKQLGPDVFQPNYLRLVGGTTWHWGAASMRMSPEDFQLKSMFGQGQDWPIGYGDILPFYEAAEIEMGVAGPDVPDGPAWQAKRLPLPAQVPSFLDKQVIEKTQHLNLAWVKRPVARNTAVYQGRPQCEGHSNCTPICPIGAQYAAIHHVERAEEAGAIVVENANVQKIDIGADDQVERVWFRRPDGSMWPATGKYYVLAANAIETPRILANSASEKNPNGVANGSGQLGRNLMTHPSMSIGMIAGDPVFAGRGPHSSLMTVSDLADPSRQSESAFLLAVQSRNEPTSAAIDAIEEGLLGDELDQEIRRRTIRQFQLFIHAEDLPEARNQVKFDLQKRDTSGMPEIMIDYRMSDYAKHGLDKGRNLVGKIATAMDGKVRNERIISEAVHLIGTAQMGPNSTTSVVNEDGATHQHRNLFLAGSATFPTGGVANPTLTIAAFSLRIADKLLEEIA